MQYGLSVVADLTGGDAEMQRAVQEVIKAFGGLDIIVNRHVQPVCLHAAPRSASCMPAPSDSQLKTTVVSSEQHLETTFGLLLGCNNSFLFTTPMCE